MHQTTNTYRTYRLCGEKQTFFFISPTVLILRFSQSAF